MKIIGKIAEIKGVDMPAGVSSKTKNPYDAYTKWSVALEGNSPTRFDWISLTSKVDPKTLQVGTVYVFDVFQTIETWEGNSRIQTIANTQPVLA